MGPTTSEAIGPKPIELDGPLLVNLRLIVEEVHHRPRSVSSDWARYHAAEVAAAASRGLVTTAQGRAFGRLWRPTAAGLALVEEQE